MDNDSHTTKAVTALNDLTAREHELVPVEDRGAEGETGDEVQDGYHVVEQLKLKSLL
jgi:hypothetical protein